MVEYKKKKLILQSGGTRNYYYKVSSDGKKKQVSKNEYLEQKGGSEKNDPDVQNELLLKSLQNKINKLMQNNSSNSSNDYIRIFREQIENIERRKRSRTYLKEQITLEQKKRENRLAKYPNSNSTSLLENLNNLIKRIEIGDTKGTYEEFHNKVIEVLDKKIEIPTKYTWKDFFDNYKKMHFKNNGSIAIIRAASNTWEGSFVTSFYNALFN